MKTQSILKEAWSLIQPPPETLFMLLWSLIILVTVLAIARYIYLHRKLGKALNAQIHHLEAVKDKEAADKLNLIEQGFSGSAFNDHWREFRETLVVKHGAILTTTDAGHFFNEFSLVDKPLTMEITRHLPGIMTSLGIVGTFGGLIIGLGEFNQTNLEDSIRTLLGGVHNAFACSFMAILCAVIITITERGIVTSLYGKVHTFQEHLNRLFNRSVTEDYLHDMVQQMGQQTQSLKSFSQDLAESIRTAMQELVGQQTTSIERSNSLIAQQIASSMNEILEPAVGRLTDAVQDVQRQQAQSSQDALKDLVSQFSDSLNQSTGRQMDGLMAAIAGSTEAMSTMKDEMSFLVQTMRSQSETQQAQVSAQMAALAELSGNQQRTMQEELGQFVTQTAATLAQVQQQMVEQSGDSVTKLGDEMTRMVEKFQERQEAALERLSTRMSTMHDELDHKLTTALERLENGSAEHSRTLADTMRESVGQMQAGTSEMLVQTHQELGAVLQHIVAQTSQMTASTERLSGRLNDYIGQLNASLDAIIRQTGATTGEMAAQQERYAQRLSELMQALAQMMGDFDARIANHRDMIAGMADGLRQFASASQAIAQSAGDYQQTHQKTQLLLGNVMTQTQLVDARLTELANFNHAFKSTVDHHGRMLAEVKDDTSAFFTEVRGGVTGFKEAVQDSMEKYHIVASGSLDSFLGKVETEMATAVKSLGSTVLELDEHLSELSETLAKTHR